MALDRSFDDPAMRIGLFYQNAPSVHVSSRVVNDLNPDVLDLGVHTRLARACEEEGLDFLFIADGWASPGPEATRVGRLDPSVLAVLLAPVLFAATRDIGVVTTLHTSWFHPVAAARIGANLDALSGGRWGINVVTGAGFGESLLHDVTPVSDHDERYAAAEEALEIMRQLWRGEECHLDGKYHTVHGRLVGPAAVQRPTPAIFSAGASSAGIRFAARNADWLFIPGRMSAAEATRRIALIREQSAQADRPEGAVKIMRHVSVIVRETPEEARRVSDWVRSTIDLPAAREYVRTISNFAQTYADVYRAYGDDDEVVRAVGVSSGAVQIHGAPDEVAERIKELYDTQECRGIALTFPLWHVEEITRFTRLVLPRLERMGLWVSPRTRGWRW
jgi:FMNH2-dependent dimethyl sulfone monooxygenase